MPSWKKVILSGSDATLNALYVTSSVTASVISASSGITGSLFGSASYALTASYALNGGGGGASDFPYTGSAIISGSLKITGSTFVSGTLYGDGSGLTNLGFGNTRKLFQSIASTTWSFTHNLAEDFPIITVYNESNDVVVPGRIETVDPNNIKVYFSIPTSGVVAVSVGGNASTASYVANAVTVGTTNLISETTSSLIIGTTTVSKVWTGSYSGAFWDYVVNNSTNYRAGNVMSVWNKVGSVQFTDTSTPDIGDTSQITFNVVINGEYADLRATTTTSGWNVKTFKRSI
jgi:hypothetical protein